MKTFRFFDFPVYAKIKIFHRKIIIYSQRVQDYSFKDQIRRASLSMLLNIAEGSAKKSDKDFAKFLEISIASANEVAACLDIMQEFGKISRLEYEAMMTDLESIVKQLGGFIKKLRKN
jgi:four helix bundle protein